MEPTIRQVAYEFMRLPYTRKLAICLELGLLTDGDAVGTADLEKFIEALRRAREHGKVARLWTLVSGDR